MKTNNLIIDKNNELKVNWLYGRGNIILNAIILDELKKIIKKYPNEIKGKMIDIGAGDAPYKFLFEKIVNEYITQDYGETAPNKKDIDIVSDIVNMPVKSSNFDLALCMEVFEHLPEPDKALKEINRILKKNAIMIFSTPQMYRTHLEPYDFFRYTKYGLGYLFKKNGFEVIYHSYRGGGSISTLLSILTPLSQYPFHALDRLFHTKNIFSNKLFMAITYIPQFLAYKIRKAFIYKKESKFRNFYIKHFEFIYPSGHIMVVRKVRLSE